MIGARAAIGYRLLCQSQLRFGLLGVCVGILVAIVGMSMPSGRRVVLRLTIFGCVIVIVGVYRLFQAGLAYAQYSNIIRRFGDADADPDEDLAEIEMEEIEEDS